MKLELPARLQAAVLDELLTGLRGLGEGEPLEVDATKVDRLDTAGLQFILVLRARPNSTVECSELVRTSASTLGVEL
ncbi:MAG: hypothetical protein MUC96_05920 [Myxococcaceae bacterium]|nr:hypothetical protein [Myxococcaceae bacterium]